MKNSLACPKCDSRRLWRIENFSTDDDVSGGRNLRVAVDKIDRGEGWFRTRESSGYFDLYLCAGCGYSELWARDFGELRHDPQKGIHAIDTSPEQGGFR